MQSDCRVNCAVLYQGQGDRAFLTQLAARLGSVLIQDAKLESVNADYFLVWQDGSLALVDKKSRGKPGQRVEIEHRQGEQKSWPMAKSGDLAQALGRKTRTIIDATAGWGQDSLAMFRMGYEVTCIERSPVMAELLADGFRRLGEQDWMQRLKLSPPHLITADAIEILTQLPDQPDCIYLDPMFPPKRKKSALAKKSIMTLRELVGEDNDSALLFAAALNSAGKRVVVKSPDYAEPLGGKPSESFHGKLIRYDVYLK